MNRRIVLDDADIVPAPKPPKIATVLKDPKPTTSKLPSLKPWFVEDVFPSVKKVNSEWHGQAPATEQVKTFDEFFAAAGLGISPYTVFCAGCHRAGDFDADNDKHTISCMTCGRTVTWAKFAKEQQGK